MDFVATVVRSARQGRPADRDVVSLMRTNDFELNLLRACERSETLRAASDYTKRVLSRMVGSHLRQ